jgi:hypothetical protein
MLMMRSTNANAKARLSSRAERQRVRIAGETQSYSLEAVAISSRFEEASKVASVLQPPDLPPKGWVAILVLSGKLIKPERVGDERLRLKRFLSRFGAQLVPLSVGEIC